LTLWDEGVHDLAGDQMTEQTVNRRRRVLGSLLPRIAATAALAGLCNLALELSRLVGVEGYPWQYKGPSFVALFLLGSLVLWLVVELVWALVGRLWVTAVLVTAATVFVAITDREKVRVRREPLYPTDWEFTGDIGFLTSMIGVRGIIYPALGTLVAAVVAVSVASAVRRRRADRSGSSGGLDRAQLGRRVLVGCSCVLALGYVGGFNSPGNGARAAYDALGATWTPWSQQRNYLGNGFVGGFLYNLDVPSVEEPRGYSAVEMARVVARYTAVAERINRTREHGGLDDVNVVMVLNESFSDPLALRGVRLPEDPIPFTRSLMSSTMSGPMRARNIGGGTANMEFEALTGMSLSQLPPQMRVPYLQLVPEHDAFPSAVGWFARNGHRTVAIHPFTTEMYRRTDVYRIFGFDDFVHDEQMSHQERIGNDGYISDAAAFGEVVHRLASEDDPMLVHLVTMQNHMPYPDRYDDPVLVMGPDGEPLTDIGQYARGLRYTDSAVRDLIGALSRSDERTILVFYGDHLPGTYPKPVIEANSNRALHQTPFFVWANFPGPVAAQPTTSPTHFVDLVLERAGAAVPPYYALLHELRQEVPAMDGGRLFDSDGHEVRRRDLSERALRLLHDYRLVQYDLSVGQRHSEQAMFTVPPRAEGSVNATAWGKGRPAAARGRKVR
jgi:hypothetical protein